jgi:hypothetical protein
VYVTLDHPFVEGLLPARHLPDACRFDHATHSWISHQGGPHFRLGDPLQVRVVSVDQLRGWVNFGLVEESEGAQRAGSPGEVRPERPRARRARPKAAPSRGRGPRRRS